MVNAAYIISDWIIDPEFGCMNLAYQEYASTALVDDGSCSVLSSSLYEFHADELSAAYTQIDELNANIVDIVLDYQGQLFDLETSLTDSLEGINVQYTFPYISGERLDVYPQVPTWALEMEIPLHPNDTPTLVRVVNMLGQEVNPDDVFDGEVLLYLYSNGTVEKAIK